MLEAFNAAKADVARVYQQRGVMLTERALLEDGGDGEGSLDPAVNGKDGSVAAMLSLGAPTEALEAAGGSEAAASSTKSGASSSGASRR